MKYIVRVLPFVALLVIGLLLFLGVGTDPASSYEPYRIATGIFLMVIGVGASMAVFVPKVWVD